MNFRFLQPFLKLRKLYEYCCEAEEFALSKPNISATSARKGMEFIVKMIYASLTGDYGVSVFEMVTDQRFVNYVNDQELINSIHFIRKMGNVAVHQGDLKSDDALDVLDELHFLVGEFCILLGLIKDYPKFEEPTAAPAAPAKPAEPVKASEPEKKVVVEPELVAVFAPRMRATRFDVKHGRDEAENKKLYLYASLREAGWAVVNHKNQAMPGAAGIQMMLDDGDTVDYVLYGRDNRPLAVVEYTETCKNIVAGRRSAIEKANKLSEKLGYKPIVYYTNGYHIYIIDQLGYKPRRVFQFHTIEELELLKLRATMRQDISAPQIDENIAGRKYQKQAITGACNAYMQNRRHALLVMATGTGKTRVSIATVDVLMKAGWVKNVLFLADRTSLVRQAHKNFNKQLPNVTTSVYSGGSLNRDKNARVIFSTYQTMINLINDDTREFGIGRFDLIIIDEAHRSIFKKYSALFHYFDALMLGLTATPRAEDNKSTYQMFELQNGHPDFAYELEQAIKDGFLVGFSVLDKTTDKMRRGITYNELSDEEKQSFEDGFATGDDGETPDFTGTVIEANKIGKKVINLGTIDAMLNDLMKNGLKVNGGDKIGKTIIFADSHFQAEIIVERFQKLYAHLDPDFCKLIDSQVVNNLGLIDQFGERDNMPQVAVSVDMMDTGIDVPDVLNLVFFKTVRSKIKFLQMIGRGTRLSPDVFGPGMDKQGFLIFDYYDNFHYFSTSNTWSMVNEDGNGAGWSATPQSILLNQRKLKIMQWLIQGNAKTPFEISYRDQLRQYFISEVQSLCNDDIEVQYNMAYVSKYRTAEMWDTMDDAKIEELTERILPLIPSESAPAKVKTFDLLMYVLEDEIPKRLEEGKDIRKIRNGCMNVGNSISSRMQELLKLKTIPEVTQKAALLRAMIDGNAIFDDFSLENCEKIRLELRDLMRYIPDKKEYHVINTSDFVIDDGVGPGLAKKVTYEDRVRDYLLTSNNPALAKLRNLDELTQEEKDELSDQFTSKLGTPADYAKWAGNAALLPFLRIQVGIADEAVQTKFGSFLNSNNLDDEQLTYMQQIIDYCRTNGDITFMDLQRVSPFCDVDIMDLFGPKIVHIKALINGLHKPVM